MTSRQIGHSLFHTLKNPGTGNPTIIHFLQSTPRVTCKLTSPCSSVSRETLPPVNVKKAYCLLKRGRSVGKV